MNFCPRCFPCIVAEPAFCQTRNPQIDIDLWKINSKHARDLHLGKLRVGSLLEALSTLRREVD